MEGLPQNNEIVSQETPVPPVFEGEAQPIELNKIESSEALQEMADDIEVVLNAVNSENIEARNAARIATLGSLFAAVPEGGVENESTEEGKVGLLMRRALATVAFGLAAFAPQAEARGLESVLQQVVGVAQRVDYTRQSIDAANKIQNKKEAHREELYQQNARIAEQLSGNREDPQLEQNYRIEKTRIAEARQRLERGESQGTSLVASVRSRAVESGQLDEQERLLDANYTQAKSVQKTNNLSADDREHLERLYERNQHRIERDNQSIKNREVDKYRTLDRQITGGNHF